MEEGSYLIKVIDLASKDMDPREPETRLILALNTHFQGRGYVQV